MAWEKVNVKEGWMTQVSKKNVNDFLCSEAIVI